MMKRAKQGAAVTILCVGAYVGFAATPAHGWDCSLPENNGVAECPLITTTTTVAPTTTTTVPETTTTVPETTTTVPARSLKNTTSTTGRVEIGTAISTARPVAAPAQLPHTGSSTGPLAAAGLVSLIAGVGVLAYTRRKKAMRA